MTPIALALALPLLAWSQEGLSSQDLRMTPEVRVVREASPAVVYIEVHRRPLQGPTSMFLRQSSEPEVISGSGAVLDKSGIVITNYHLIGNRAFRITVEFDHELDERVYEADLISVAAREDLALLKITGEREFPVLRRGTSSDLMIGERVIAIGNPLRQRLSVSSGIISGLHRNVSFSGRVEFTDLIQTDAAINLGNSGGPLLNILGELIGINTAVNEGAQSVGFAIPVDRVEAVLRDVLLVPGAARAWLGMELDEEHSFSVCDLVPGGPADQAGVQVGDHLIELDGLRLDDSESYRAKLVSLAPNQPALFTFSRPRLPGQPGSPTRYEVTLAGWNKAAALLHQRLGLSVEQIALGLEPRVLVTRVMPGSPAAELGLAPGDVIDALRVNKGPTWIANTPWNLASIVAGLAPGTELTLDVLRDADQSGQFEATEIFRGQLTLR